MNNTIRSIRPPTMDELQARSTFATLEDLCANIFEEMKPSNRMSVTEASEAYTRVNNGPGLSKPWSASTTPYLRDPQDILTSLEFTGMIFVGPARTGKALPLDTEIPTPKGWKTMGSLKEGDYVFGANGLPTQILFATETMYGHDCYEITFKDGAKVVADADHLWAVRDIELQNRKQQLGLDRCATNRVMTTKQMLDEGVTFNAIKPRSRFAIPVNQEVNYPEADLLLDPYMLGLWLGDGCKHNGTISVGRDDLDETVANITSRGYKVSIYKPSNVRRCFRLAVQGPDGVFLDQYLSTIGFVGDVKKHIPLDYMTASASQRRELLRGLMDTDGTIYGANGRHVQFVSVDPALTAQVRELVASLGHKVSTRSKPSAIGRKRYKDAHLAEFTIYDASQAFAMPRKIARCCTLTGRRESEVGSRFIASIVKVETRPVRCIKVASEDSLFLATRDYVVTHNTLMGLSWVTHTVKTDPADMLYVHMDRENARKWSNGDLQRYLMASTSVRAEQITARQHDNTFDKTFKSGMRFLLTYPTASNLSGITVGRVMLIDYDRMDDDVDGEGNPFDLASMRTTTFKRFAMTVAESSPNPNKEIADPRWIPETPHAAPPVKGIFELYNRGDRRRWHWCCPQCDDWFEPSFSRLDWGGETDPMTAREKVAMVCPHGCVIPPKMKDVLNANGRWVREGERITPGADGVVETIPGQKVTRSSIASFWLKGPAAAYQEWGALVEKYLRAQKALAETGDDGPLRKTITTDQGEFYIPQSRLGDLSPEVLKNKAEDWGSTPENPTVPQGVRFLVATVDVQKHSFVVQITGYTATGDRVVVDAFKVNVSKRLNSRDENLPIDPAAYGEDWDNLIDGVMDRTYELADGSGRRMRIRGTVCDSGGAEGVTGHAYNFWRRLRAMGRHTRFGLVKGNGTSLSIPEVRTARPDSSQKDAMAVARGDVPVMMLNSNKLKDRVNLLLQRTVDDNASEGGRVRYPDWLENWFYTQLTSEIREKNGKWTNTRKRRNETFDLTCYGEAAVIRPIEPSEPFVHFGYDRMRFDGTEPIWAKDWDENELVFGGVQDQVVKPKASVSFGDLAEKLA